MSTKEVSAPVVAVYPPVRVSDLLTFSKSFLSGLENNSALPHPSPSAATLKTQIEELDAAHTSAANGDNGAVQVRNMKEKKVRRTLGLIAGYVQTIVDDNPAEGPAVIASVHLSIRKPPQRSTPELSAKNTTVAGEVQLKAKSVAPKATYYWQYSLNQTDWIGVPETMRASTVISGLPLKATAYFRFCALTPSGKKDYSQVVSLFVM